MDYLDFLQQYSVLSKLMALGCYARNIVEHLARLWPCREPQSLAQCLATPLACKFNLD